jgi:predicted ferric reductase
VTAGHGGLSRIQWALGGLLLAMLALWLATAPFGGLGPGVFAWRAPSLQGTGTLAMAAMSVAMVLATRPVFFEPWLGGLDKMYRLHKWLGISALGFAVGHWLWVEAPKWMVELGGLVRPARVARVPSAEPEPAVWALLHGLRDPAEGLGEWAFYALVLLIALALWKRFPYRRFFQTHRLLPVVYLVLVFHAVVLTSDGSWAQPVGVVMAVLMLAGTVAAIVVLLGAVGRSRHAVAEVDALSLPAGADVLQVDVRLKSRWAGHEAGQFAFVRFDAGEGAHPFTITSPWQGDGRPVFLIKGLGDYTRQLPALLKAGDLLRVEGPYGTFNFAGEKSSQVWVGGGIGITPFIARLQQLALCPDGKAVDLFYTTATPRDGVVARLTAAAQAAGARLHVMVDAVDGRLNAERLCAVVPGWRTADVWFCGPAAFGQALRRDLLAKGLPGRDFHQELFNLR